MHHAALDSNQNDPVNGYRVATSPQESSAIYGKDDVKGFYSDKEPPRIGTAPVQPPRHRDLVHHPWRGSSFYRHLLP